MSALLVATLFATTFPTSVARAQSSTRPELHDDRLEFTLVAEEPDIVTPIGMAIGTDDRLYVIESHTHDRPDDYAGPPSDRIKVFRDSERSNRLELIGVFAEGFDAAMNLAFAPDGTLYVCCAREVYALPDRNGDGVCDSEERTRVLELKTRQGYAHNCLMGITLDNRGQLTISRGNVGSMAHTLQGSDGSSVSGYGDGGSVYRCQPDGSQVELLATGFWNPFELLIDRSGRLIAIDNDPDGRGPNRIVHVVDRGDYGYRSVYGGSGNHPFQGWDGDLPGLLPFAGGTGEAPSGALDCRRASLPAEYGDSLLVAVWNENTIERHEIEQVGLSFQTKRTQFAAGPKDFRPVSIDANSKGVIYVTDWVRVAYPNHGHGRIWRIDWKDAIDLPSPRRRRHDPYEPNPFRVAAEATGREYEELRSALLSDDAFQRHLAIGELAEQVEAAAWNRLAGDADPRVRLGALLSAQAAGTTVSVEAARKWLSDKDLTVRQAALIWVGRSLQPTLLGELHNAIEQQPVTGSLFATYLAAVESLDPEFVHAFRTQANSRSNKLPREIDQSLLRAIVADMDYSGEVRGLAIDHLRVDGADLQRLCWDALASGEPALQSAAIRKLSEIRDPPTERKLLEFARNREQHESLRADAVAGLALAARLEASELIPLIQDDSESVALEAARALRHLPGDGGTRKRLSQIYESTSTMADRAPLVEQLAFVLGIDQQKERPQSVGEWKQRLAGGGDAARGRRVFYSPHATCSKCHTVGGRGGTLGPDLSHVAQSVSRDQIIHSILRPSDQFAPQYQAWQIVTTDGRVHTGLQIDHKARGNIDLFTTEGRNVRFQAEEIETYLASPNSVMPTGLEAALGVHEFQDLIAFLMNGGR